MPNKPLSVISPGQFLNIGEAATIAGVDRATIEAALDSKALRASRTFKPVTLIKSEDLATWVDSRQPGGAR